MFYTGLDYTVAPPVMVCLNQQISPQHELAALEDDPAAVFEMTVSTPSIWMSVPDLLL